MTDDSNNEEADGRESGTITMDTSDKEAILKCPYCGEEKKSRGLFAHIMNSDGNGHGPYREVPDNFEQSEAEVVGYESVNTKNPVSGSESGKELILCKICGNTAKGLHGHHIHLRKMAGKKNHPENPEDIGDNQYRAIPTDENWNPVGPSSDRELDEDYQDVLECENGTHDNESDRTKEGMFIPVDEMRELQDLLIRSRKKQPVVDEIERLLQRYS